MCPVSSRDACAVRILLGEPRSRALGHGEVALPLAGRERVLELRTPVLTLSPSDDEPSTSQNNTVTTLRCTGAV